MEENKKAFYDRHNISIETAIQDAQLLVAYIANTSSVSYNKKTLEIIIQSKYLLQESKWSQQAETAFWIAYDELAKQISPVTINSLKSSLPVCFNIPRGGSHRKYSKAFKAVLHYRLLALITLLALLSTQIYYIIGANAVRELQTIFEQRRQVRVEMDRLKDLKNLKVYGKYISDTNDAELNKLKKQNLIYNQKLDVKYYILLKWNRIWQSLLLQGPSDPKLREYREFEHNEMVKYIQDYFASKQTSTINKASDEASPPFNLKERMLEMKLNHAAMKARYKLFATCDSAKFVLISFQTYFLPLLYGLMGAIMFALRMLANEIKNLTYDMDSQIRYRLRIIIGAISGLMIGLFINPHQIGAANLIAPMSISFIAGYNVELLFSIMDRAIQTLSKTK